MRTKNILMMAAVAGAMTLGSCSNNDEFNDNSNFPADGVIRVTTNIDAPITRVGMTTENIATFNIKITNAANTAYSYFGWYENEKGVWNSYTDIDKGTPLTMLWQNSKQPVTVMAISRHGSAFTEPFFDGENANQIAYHLSQNQSSEDNVKNSDILYMAPTTIDPANDLVNGKLPISFKHLMSKVNLSVTLGTELNTTPGTDTNPISELTVNGTKTSFRWNPKTDDYFEAVAIVSDIVTPFVGTYTAGSGTTTRAVANYEVILVPQTVAANTFSVTFKIGEKTYSWTSADAVTLERGKQYTLTLNVGKDIVTLGSLSAKAWTEGTGGSIETE